MGDLRSELPVLNRREQWIEEVCGEFSVTPLSIASAPIDPKEILWGNLPALRVIIAQGDGVGAVLVYHDKNIQPAAPSPGATEAHP